MTRPQPGQAAGRAVEVHPRVQTTLGRIRSGRALLHQAYRDLDRATGTAVGKADQTVERRQRDLNRLYEELNRQHHRGLHTLTDTQVMNLTRPGTSRPGSGSGR